MDCLLKSLQPRSLQYTRINGSSKGLHSSIKGAISDLSKWQFPVKVFFILFFKYNDYTLNYNPAQNYNHILSFTGYYYIHKEGLVYFFVL